MLEKKTSKGDRLTFVHLAVVVTAATVGLGPS